MSSQSIAQIHFIHVQSQVKCWNLISFRENILWNFPNFNLGLKSHNLQWFMNMYLFPMHQHHPKYQWRKKKISLVFGEDIFIYPQRPIVKMTSTISVTIYMHRCKYDELILKANNYHSMTSAQCIYKYCTRKYLSQISTTGLVDQRVWIKSSPFKYC